jgi:predicted transcriptional regulator
MTDLMQKALAAVRKWADARQDEAAELLLAIDRLGPDAYRASPEELAAIDAALAEVARGELASEEHVEAAFARFRK